MKQGYEDGNYDIEYKSTENMISDTYTKPIGGGPFKKFRAQVMGHIRASGTNMRTAGVRRDNTHSHMTSNTSHVQRLESKRVSRKTSMSAKTNSRVNESQNNETHSRFPYTY